VLNRDSFVVAKTDVLSILERTSNVVIIRDQELLVLAPPEVIRTEWKHRGFFLEGYSRTIIINRESVHSWVIDEAGKGLMSHTKVWNDMGYDWGHRTSETRGYYGCSWRFKGPAIFGLLDVRRTRFEGRRYRGRMGVFVVSNLQKIGDWEGRRSSSITSSAGEDSGDWDGEGSHE
jgi:hypothetical protein